MLCRQFRRGVATLQLTKDRYPETKRSNYALLTDKHVQTFERIIGPERVVTDPSELECYNVDWLKTCKGYSSLALRPKTTQEVSEIMKFCHSENLAVVPQGGNTGLVGGSVPVFDEVVLSLGLMNKIYHIDELGSNISCQAGCVLETLDNTLENHGLMMPLDLGAKGSCQIGGNISTCAGGLRYLRYGSMLANTMGVEVVKADGEIIDLMSTLRKDNTGFHLRQLFVGSEGTLGIVTGAVIQCAPRPKSVCLAFLGCNDFNKVLGTYSLARKMLSEILSACELMDEISLETVNSKLGLSTPISQHPFSMMIETHGSDETHDEQKLCNFLEKAMEMELVSDGTYTKEPSRVTNLWQVRERIPEALLKDAYLYKYDVTLPLKHFYEAVEVMRERLKGSSALTISGFGHLGDANLHLNIQGAHFEHSLLNAIEPFVFEWTHKKGGSISAEHGIGFKKPKFMKYSKSQGAIEMMRQIKGLFDPKNILNPYKVIPKN